MGSRAGAAARLWPGRAAAPGAGPVYSRRRALTPAERNEFLRHFCSSPWHKAFASSIFGDEVPAFLRKSGRKGKLQTRAGLGGHSPKLSKKAGAPLVNGSRDALGMSGKMEQKDSVHRKHVSNGTLQKKFAGFETWLPVAIEDDGYGGWSAAIYRDAPSFRLRLHPRVLGAAFIVATLAAATWQVRQRGHIAGWRPAFPPAAVQLLTRDTGHTGQPQELPPSTEETEKRDEVEAVQETLADEEEKPVQAESQEEDILRAAELKVAVRALPDPSQALILKALQSLEVVDAVDGAALCTRRDYARWLVKSCLKLSSNSATRVYPSMYVEHITEVAFADVTPEDPDFVYIQGLAEAGIVDSRLMDADIERGGDVALHFNPDSPLRRRDLIEWRIALESCSESSVSVEDVASECGILDAGELKAELLPAVLQDLQAGADSVIAATFGSTRLLHPEMVVTCQQAAASLSAGRPAAEVAEHSLQMEMEAMASEEAARAAYRAELKEELQCVEAEIVRERTAAEAAQLARATELEALREGLFALHDGSCEVTAQKVVVDAILHAVEAKRNKAEEQLNRIKLEVEAVAEEYSTVQSEIEVLTTSLTEDGHEKQRLVELRDAIVSLRSEAEALARAKQEEVGQLVSKNAAAEYAIMKARTGPARSSRWTSSEANGSVLRQTLRSLSRWAEAAGRAASRLMEATDEKARAIQTRLGEKPGEQGVKV